MTRAMTREERVAFFELLLREATRQTGIILQVAPNHEEINGVLIIKPPRVDYVEVPGWTPPPEPEPPVAPDVPEEPKPPLGQQTLN